MLENICVKNIGLVENINIDFNEESTMFSGETGAGKSMLLSSLLLLLGERSDSNTIRQGSTQASITAVWNISNHYELHQWLEERSIIHDGVELLIRRNIKQNGRNQCYIQDQSLTVKEMGECMEFLCEIHTQHEHQSLFKSSAQLLIIDKFAGIRDRVEIFSKAFQTYNEKLRQYTQAQENEHARIRELDYLEFAAQEIANSHIILEEDEKIIEELRSVSNLETITELWQKIDGILYEESGVLSGIRKVFVALGQLDSLQSGITKYYERMDSILIELDDIVDELRSEKDKISQLDTEAIVRLENRLLLLEGLKQKYGKSLVQVSDFQYSAESKIALLKNFEEKKGHRAQELELEYKKLQKESIDISNIRKDAAIHFAEEVNVVLHQLAMEKAVFSVQIESRDIEKQGIDDVRFFISSNTGEIASPLIKIASGGELSRIMLAIKVVSSRNVSLQTLVLDEVDAGIGGNTAKVLAQYLYELARNTQIICVTHLPMVAACARTHYKVYKFEENNRTKVDITLLQNIDRIKELSRMIVGNEDDILAQNQSKKILSHYL